MKVSEFSETIKLWVQAIPTLRFSRWFEIREFFRATRLCAAVIWSSRERTCIQSWKVAGEHVLNQETGWMKDMVRHGSRFEIDKANHSLQMPSLRILPALLTYTVLRDWVFLYTWCSRKWPLCAYHIVYRVLLMCSRMPYSPTETFPHPLANIRSSDMAIGMTNRLSYVLIERLTWHELGDLINKFREEKLGLTPLNLMWATGLITRLKIPYTYCW